MGNSHAYLHKIPRKRNSQELLLLAVNNVPSSKSLITGKIFEYLQSQRPVIGIGPVDGDLAAILNETGAGQVVDFEDLVSLKQLISKYYRLYRSGKLKGEARNIDRYHRKHLTKDLAGILKSLR